MIIKQQFLTYILIWIGAVWLVSINHSQGFTTFFAIGSLIIIVLMDINEMEE